MRERNHVLETTDTENFASGLDNFELLAFSIVRLAVIEFKKYLEILTTEVSEDKYKKLKKELFDILKFFNSEWYICLCNIHPTVMFKQLKLILESYLKKDIYYKDLFLELLNYMEEK